VTRPGARSGIVAAALLAGSAAQGQGGTAITATAVVVTVGLTVATVSNLNFGTVVAGVPTSVAFTAPGAGAGATVFDPSVGDIGRLGPPPNPNLYIWVGGTVSPPAGAKPGIYVGTIILSLVYT